MTPDKNFVFKKLDQGDIEVFNDLLRYAFQVTSADLRVSGWSNKEIQQSKQPIFDFSYVFGWITGIIFLAIEKEDEFVRKSAAQSFVLSLFLLACNLLVFWIPIAGPVLSGCIGFGGFLLWIILIVKAVQNVYFRLPVISTLSENYVMRWFL